MIIDAVQLPGRKEDQTDEILFNLTKERIYTHNADIHIYTDGSTDGSQRNGGAGFCVIDNRDQSVIAEQRHPAGKWCSSYAGECVAMKEAVAWINREGDPEKKTLDTHRQQIASRIDQSQQLEG